MAASQDKTIETKDASSARILAADLLVVDELVAIPSAQELAQTSDNLRNRYTELEGLLQELLAKKGTQHGDKISINAEEYKKLSAALAGLPGKMEAGGSTADILTTVHHLLDNKADIDLLGIAGSNNVNDNLITEDLRRNGINVNPGATYGARSAVSFIFTYPDGKRTTITYPGNAAEKLKSDSVTDARVAGSDTVFIPISLWSKFDSSLPDALLQKSWDQDKQIILSIPKQARFDYGGPQDIHKQAIPKADIIVGDEEELARFYKTQGNTELTIQNLEADMAKHDAMRNEAGKLARSKPATALIKHKDDSVTILVAGASRGATQRYEIAAPLALSGKKHTLGVDDAIYAGFIAALTRGMPAQKAAEFAMSVAQTKFLYDSARIPGPVGADAATQERWKGLRSNLGDTFAGVGSAFGYATTGVSNVVDPNLPRTKGQKAFDLILYPLIANIGVSALSMFVTYHSNFNQNKANVFVKRSSWFKEQLTKIPGLGKSPEMVKNLNMVIWSFVDGTLMSPVVAWFESKRQKISRWLDDRMGTAPKDTSIYDNEIQRNWWDVLKARAATFVVVIATYFTLNAKIFPRNTQEGILSETAPSSGIFKRDTVKSINGFVFDIPSKIIGGALTKVNSIRNWAEKISGNQLKAMAEKTGTTARPVKPNDVSYQVEGLVNTGLFELVYTSLCTAGLFFLGKTFAAKRQNKKEEISAAQRIDAGSPAASSGSDEQAAQTLSDASSLHTDKIMPKSRSEKAKNHVETIDKSRSANLQIGA